MQFIKDSSENSHVITGIDEGAIRVDEHIVTSSLVLSASTLDSWPVKHVSEIKLEHWELILATEPEIILLGTGPTLIFPEPHQLKAAYERQIAEYGRLGGVDERLKETVILNETDYNPARDLEIDPQISAELEAMNESPFDVDDMVTIEPIEKIEGQ